MPKNTAELDSGQVLELLKDHFGPTVEFAELRYILNFYRQWGGHRPMYLESKQAGQRQNELMWKSIGDADNEPHEEDRTPEWDPDWNDGAGRLYIPDHTNRRFKTGKVYKHYVDAWEVPASEEREAYMVYRRVSFSQNEYDQYADGKLLEENVPMTVMDAAKGLAKSWYGIEDPTWEDLLVVFATQAFHYEVDMPSEANLTTEFEVRVENVVLPSGVRAVEVTPLFVQGEKELPADWAMIKVDSKIDLHTATLNFPNTGRTLGEDFAGHHDKIWLVLGLQECGPGIMNLLSPKGIRIKIDARVDDWEDNDQADLITGDYDEVHDELEAWLNPDLTTYDHWGLDSIPDTRLTQTPEDGVLRPV